MKLALALGGALLLVLVAFVGWRYHATVKGGERVYQEALDRIAPVLTALQAGETPPPEELARFARAGDTRKVLFESLREYGRLDLFPREHLTWEALAEADLVLWLWHPNELAAPPDEIELMKQVPAPDAEGSRELRYFVFRFRTKPPHWASEDGWMAGVAGPYPTSEAPRPYARGTFSRFEAYDSRTPEEHVRVTHEQVLGERSRPAGE
ncbi:MAG TPA: hypothetical protein VFM88_04890 [Vicinamibacteria bacterium]|nr:hypothetical protein [Vicinamibacteria bacterium]